MNKKNTKNKKKICTKIKRESHLFFSFFLQQHSFLRHFPLQQDQMKIGFMEYINIGMEAKENMKKVNYIFSILRHFDITKQQRKYPSPRWNG